MKQRKYSETQILKILKENETGASVAELSRKYGFYYKTLYQWKKKYYGITEGGVVVQSNSPAAYKALSEAKSGKTLLINFD